MHDSVTKLEDFSCELFLELFEYIPIRDRFRAFHGLNAKIDCALASSDLVVDLTGVSRSTYEEFYAGIVLAHQSERVRTLKISNELTLGLLETFFQRFNLYDFRLLRSLTLIKPSYMTLGSLALQIPHLEQLQHLSVDSNSYPSSFFRRVTCTPSPLTACYLPELEISEEISFQSAVTHLTVTVEDITILLNVLAVFPRLEYLHVSLRSTLSIDESTLPELPVLSCPQLRVLKLRISEGSGIDFHEIECFFQQTSFPQLQSLSYECITHSLSHVEVTRWNDLLATYLSGIDTWNLLARIPYNAYSHINIEQVVANLQQHLCYSCSMTISIDYAYFIIHSNAYPKRHFDLSLKPVNSEQHVDCDPLNSDSPARYSRVNSLIVDAHCLTPCMTFSPNIQHLHLRGHNSELTLSRCLRYCSHQLRSLKLVGLPSDLPALPRLRELTIQQAMFTAKMVAPLSLLCPGLELLTTETDCIEQFGDTFDRLRDANAFPNLKFLRVFSRDANRRWASWLCDRRQQQRSATDRAQYEARNQFLFIWL